MPKFSPSARLISCRSCAVLLDKLIIAITTTDDQAIRQIGQLKLVEACLVMINPVSRNTQKAGVHGRQIIKHVF